MKATTHKMTYDQYCLLPEDRNQYELFDGELVMTPAPSPQHQEIVTQITRALSNFVQRKSFGKVYVAPLDTIFDPHTVLQPDVLFIRRNRLHIVAEDGVRSAPDLVVEVLSPSTFHKDLRRKMAVYSQFGVSEYWVVDPETQSIDLYCRGKQGLELLRRFSVGENFESRLLAGFRHKIKGSTLF